MRRLLFSIGAVGAFMLAPSLSTPALACSCAVRDVRSTFGESDAVFSGRVLQTEGEFLRVRFEVDRVWKGEARTEIVVFNGAVVNGALPSGRNSCSIPFVVGQKYVIHARKHSDQLVTGECQGTDLLTEDTLRARERIQPSRRIGTEVRRCAGAERVTGDLRLVAADSKSAPLADARVIVEGAGRQHGALTDAQGRLVFSGLQPGEYRLTLDADGYTARYATVALPPDGCMEANMFLIQR